MRAVLLIVFLVLLTPFSLHSADWGAGSSSGVENSPIDRDGDGVSDFMRLTGSIDTDANVNVKDIEAAIALLTDDEITLELGRVFGVAGLTAASDGNDPLVEITRDDVTILCDPAAGIDGFDETQIVSVTGETPLLRLTDTERITIRECVFDGQVDAAYAASSTQNNSGIQVWAGSDINLIDITVRDTDGSAIMLEGDAGTRGSYDVADDQLERVLISRAYIERVGKALATGLTSGQWDDAIVIDPHVELASVDDVTVQDTVFEGVGASSIQTTISNSTTNATNSTKLRFINNISRDGGVGETTASSMYEIAGVDDLTISGGTSDTDVQALKLGDGSSPGYCSGAGDHHCVTNVLLENFVAKDCEALCIRTDNYTENFWMRNVMVRDSTSDCVFLDTPYQGFEWQNITLRDCGTSAIDHLLGTGDGELAIYGLVIDGVGDDAIQYPDNSTSGMTLLIDGFSFDGLPINFSYIWIGADTDVDSIVLRNGFADMTDSNSVNNIFMYLDEEADGQGTFNNFEFSDIVINDGRHTSEIWRVGRDGTDPCLAATNPNACCTDVNEGPTCASTGPGLIQNVTFTWQDSDPIVNGSGNQGIDIQDEEPESDKLIHMRNVTCAEPDGVLGEAGGGSTGFDCVGGIGVGGHADPQSFTHNSEFIEDEEPNQRCNDGQTYTFVEPNSGDEASEYQCFDTRWVSTGAPLFMSESGTTVTAEARGHAYYLSNTGSVTVTLPPVAHGMRVCVYDVDATAAVIIEVDDNDIIKLNGTNLDAGDTIDSGGAAGDFMCLNGLDTLTWITTESAGTWTDGGAT